MKASRGGVIDGHVQVVPADAAVLGHADPMAGDAVTDPVDAAELLGVDVDQLARPLMLVADDGRLGIERAEPAKAGLKSLTILTSHIETHAFRTDHLVRAEEMNFVVARQGGDLIGADRGPRSASNELPSLIDEPMQLGDVDENFSLRRRSVVGLQRADELGLEPTRARVDQRRQRVRS